jgi:hypothetical protein
MKTIEELAKKHAYDNEENLRQLVDSQLTYVKLRERYTLPRANQKVCHRHTVVLIDTVLLPETVTFGCLNCGYREDWGPEKTDPLTN